MGTLWIVGWLFTLGVIKPKVGKAILAFFIWPYYLAERMKGMFK